MTQPLDSLSTRVAIIGAGPAGLIAAEVLSEAGVQVDVFDAMPSVGRKFLLAGVGGMNITHSEPYEAFVGRYGARQAEVKRLLDAFTPDQLREWIHGLGIETFVGSSGKVFPTDMKAAPLLRAWLHRLKSRGVRLHVRHRWTGWSADEALTFSTPNGDLTVRAEATVLALGGASWPKLGSDGSWVERLVQRGVNIAPLQAANCGFELNWTDHLKQKFAGSPLKSVHLSYTAPNGTVYARKGECVLTEQGLEGNLIYALGAPIRDAIRDHGPQTVYLDLLPDRPADKVLAEVAHPRGSRSLSSHLESRLGLKGVRTALIYECVSKTDMQNPTRLAAAIKALPLSFQRPRPLAEAISTAGGVQFEALNHGLMLTALPGTFCAGEMLDWEAPTGGYLLTGCFASGRMAAHGVLKLLSR
ncbi:TIGR03862 family flavoprotein [Burkholderiaceae bacterium DAT-1]|nr:TIGR03862 family flavoprotein [Burkholderiaceae bacterium DAT-1]